MLDNTKTLKQEGENADNLGSIAWLFLQENVQVQYLQKIALRAENPYGPRQYGFAVFSALAIFCCH